jgi:hypothetical protein
MHDIRRRHMFGASIVRRIVAPPASPFVVAPPPLDGSERIAAQDPRPNIGKAPGRKIVVDSVDTVLVPMSLIRDLGLDEFRKKGEGFLPAKIASLGWND